MRISSFEGIFNLAAESEFNGPENKKPADKLIPCFNQIFKDPITTYHFCDRRIRRVCPRREMLA